MASENHPRIAELKMQLAQSRQRIDASLGAVEDRINLLQRFKSDLADHPLKWLGVAAGAGFVAQRLLPFAWRLARPSMVTSLLGPALRTAMIAAVPLVSEVLHQKLAPTPNSNPQPMV